MTADDVKRQEDANEKSNRSYLNYAHRCMLLSLRSMGFGGQRLRALSYNSHDVGEAYMDESKVPMLLTPLDELLAGADAEFGEPDFHEVVDGTYWKLRRDLLAFGWDPEAVLWKKDKPFGEGDFPVSWRKVTVSQRRKREAFLFYANEMSLFVLTMMCMAAVELHRTNGFGAGRLDTAMAPVRERWIRLMRIYLAMDSDGVNREMKAVLREFNEMQVFTEEFAV